MQVTNWDAPCNKVAAGTSTAAPVPTPLEHSIFFWPERVNSTHHQSVSRCQRLAPAENAPSCQLLLLSY